jgi:hypothetical protein
LSPLCPRARVSCQAYWSCAIMRGRSLTVSIQISVAALHACRRSPLHIARGCARCVSAGNCLLRINAATCGKRSLLEQESCLSGTLCSRRQCLSSQRGVCERCLRYGDRSSDLSDRPLGPWQMAYSYSQYRHVCTKEQGNESALLLLHNKSMLPCRVCLLGIEVFRLRGSPMAALPLVCYC